MFADATIENTYNGLHPSLDTHWPSPVNSGALLPGPMGRPENSATTLSLGPGLQASSGSTLAGNALPQKLCSGGVVQASGSPPTTTDAIGIKQTFPQIVVHASDTNWGHFTDSPVVLRNMQTLETIVIGCIVCGTNQNRDNGFIIGVNGMWSHLTEGHASAKPKLLEGESKENYVVRTCKLENIDARMAFQILNGRKKLTKIAPNQAIDDNGTTVAAGDHITVQDVPGLEKLPHVVRFVKNGVPEDRLRLLYCPKCGANASREANFFLGVNALANHIRMAHNVKIGMATTASYVFKNCPFDSLHWDDAFHLLQAEPMPLPYVKGVIYQRKELVLLNN